MILWEYKDKGCDRYIYISDGVSCDVCNNLNGQIFDIFDAEVGVNLQPMHPNCDCVTGILDKNGNIVALLTNKKTDEKSKDKNKLLDYLQTALDIAGLVPGIGEIADGTNAAIYALRGDYLNAGLSGAAMIPFTGWFSTGGKFARKAIKLADKVSDTGKVSKKVTKEVIEGARSKLKVIDGKVGGKVPVEDFDAIRKSSVKNQKSDSITLGKYTEDVDSYISKAGKDSSYFDLGSDWGKIQNKYNLSDAEMFEYFNKPALNYAISGGKSIRFSHDPRGAKGFFGSEWSYIKETLNLTDDSLIEIGAFL